MAKAFKCDMCDACKQFKEDKPYELRICDTRDNYDSGTYYELCEECATKVFDILKGKNY